jgi:glycosyltransferase involved in cell wall biosynthesis
MMMESRSTVDRPRISTVICAYTLDRWPEIVKAIDSVRRQERAGFEIALVVDHNPQLLERARDAFEGVIVVENSYAQGLSGARNTGVEATSGDVVAFLDDDAAADPGWLRWLADTYDDPDVLGVGGYIAPAWETARPRWWPDEFDWVIGCSYRGLPRERSEVRNPIGANMSFRRDVLRKAGRFTSGIGRIGTRPLGAEETELSIRARRAFPQGRVMYEPRARVSHLVPAARATSGYFLRRCYAEGLSKAAISDLVGAEHALASERSYAVRTLGRGVLRNLGDTVRDRDPAPAARAAWIATGLAVTTAGFVVGKVQAGAQRRARPR